MVRHLYKILHINPSLHVGPPVVQFPSSFFLPATHQQKVVGVRKRVSKTFQIKLLFSSEFGTVRAPAKAPCCACSRRRPVNVNVIAAHLFWALSLGFHPPSHFTVTPPSTPELVYHFGTVVYVQT